MIIYTIGNWEYDNNYTEKQFWSKAIQKNEVVQETALYWYLQHKKEFLTVAKGRWATTTLKEIKNAIKEVISYKKKNIEKKLLFLKAQKVENDTMDYYVREYVEAKNMILPCRIVFVRNESSCSALKQVYIEYSESSSCGTIGASSQCVMDAFIHNGWINAKNKVEHSLQEKLKRVDLILGFCD